MGTISDARRAFSIESEEHLKHIAGPINMGGPYNLSDNGYDFCQRGLECFFPLKPGDPFPAIAELKGGFSDPFFHLQIRRQNGGNEASSLFKEERPSEPAEKFRSHGHCMGSFLLNTPVPVTVHITKNAKGGVEVDVR